MSVGRREAARHLRRDEAQLLHLVARVEAVAPRAPFRDDRPVALLPVTDRRGGNLEHPSHRADAVDAAAAAKFIRHGVDANRSRHRKARCDEDLTSFERTSSDTRQNVIRSAAMLGFARRQSAASGGPAQLTAVETSRPSADGGASRRISSAAEMPDLEPFAVEVQRRNDVTIVQPRGELDLATVETLRAALGREIETAARAWCSICAACLSSTPPVCICWSRSTSARSATDSS